MVRVAGYCRVSTEKDDQVNSFMSQQRYFREYIQNHPGWELFDIYADEGITGTSTKKRTQFNQMINDAYAGKFHKIITKEVSRFSRNILDTIAYTRELRAIGIGVIFATDQIDTLDSEAEMLLSFLASIAQEESRRTSARVVWGQTRQMEKGIVFGQSMLGYNVKDGKLAIHPEGAEIIRLIFHKYAVEQVSTSEIARYLTNKGFQTYKGCTKWKPNTVIRILKNEKYVGDLIQKKTYTPDYLTHEKRTNHDAVPKIIIKNHHEPIISREIWENAQARLYQNNKHREGDWGHSNRYVFSGKIKCGVCGSSFVGRFKYLTDGTKIRRWSCSTATREGMAGCDVGRLVRDDDAMQMLKTAIRSLYVDFDALVQDVTELALKAVLAGQAAARDDPSRLRQELDWMQQKKVAVMDAYFSQEISREDMMVMTTKYDQQLIAIRKRLEDAVMQKGNNQNSAALRSKIKAEVTSIINGELESEVFCKIMLKSLTVFKDRHMELRLNWLPQVFHFSG